MGFTEAVKSYSAIKKLGCSWVDCSFSKVLTVQAGGPEHDFHQPVEMGKSVFILEILALETSEPNTRRSLEITGQPVLLSQQAPSSARDPAFGSSWRVVEEAACD